jgi:hypothetical protein
MSTRKKLPVGIQAFREIRGGGYYSVDKTGFALRLIVERNSAASAGRRPGSMRGMLHRWRRESPPGTPVIELIRTQQCCAKPAPRG